LTKAETGFLVFWFSGFLVFWFSGFLVFWFSGFLVFWAELCAVLGLSGLRP